MTPEQLEELEYLIADPDWDVSQINDAWELLQVMRARVRELETDRDSIAYAAHMPADYQFGLASWINQHLYACYIGAKISQHITDLVESGRLTFPNAPVAQLPTPALDAPAEESETQ